MFSEKNLNELHLTEEQLAKYREFERKETELRALLRRCRIHPAAIDRICSLCDLNLMDLNNLETLEEEARREWAGFIINNDKENTSWQR